MAQHWVGKEGPRGSHAKEYTVPDAGRRWGGPHGGRSGGASGSAAHPVDCAGGPGGATPAVYHGARPIHAAL